MNLKKHKLKKSKARRAVENAREKLENEQVRHAFSWVFSVVVTFALGALAAVAMFQSVTMQESSMEPTLSVGDRYLMNRVVYMVSEPERGDIIAFRTSGSKEAALHIRRVVGLPGETIQIANGNILINGETYREGKDFPTISNPGMAVNPVTLGSDEYFVLGDNRNNSEDSRYGDIGKVSQKYIVGKLWFTISPMSKFGFLKG